MATVSLKLLEGKKQPSIKRINKWINKHHEALIGEINKRIKTRKVIKIHKIAKLTDELLWIDVEFYGLQTDTDPNKACQDIWNNGMRISFNCMTIQHKISKKSILVWT